FHDGLVVDGLFERESIRIAVFPPVGQQPFEYVFGQEFHGSFLSLGLSKTRKGKAGRRSAGVTQDSVRFGRAPSWETRKRKNLWIDDGARRAILERRSFEKPARLGKA